MYARHQLITFFLKTRQASIARWQSQPDMYQHRWLQTLVTSGKNTAFGQQYGLSDIKTLQQLQQRVPIHDYDKLKPYIERQMQGEANVLSPRKVHWFAKSSGTTSDKSKFIPVTSDALYQGHYKGAQDIMTLYMQQHPNSQLYNGKGIVLGGSHNINYLNRHSRYGDLSAVLLQNMPWAGKLAQTPSLDIALMDNWELKLEKLAAATIPQQITHLAGVPSWITTFIRYILHKTGKKNLAEVWQGIELYLHGGINFEPYRDQIAALIGKPIQYWQTYNASEGFFGIQGDSQSEDMLLLVNHGIVYEFLPLAELTSPSPRALALHEVEIGKHYALIITTNGGLWRYMIGDTVQITGKTPYRLRVSGRTKHFINAFGEEVIVDNADAALAAACRIHKATISDYTVAPIFSNAQQVGCHQWIIEFEKSPDNLAAFAQSLDTSLQSLNSDYEAKRKANMLMRQPEIIAVPQGSFYSWLQHKGKLGGQNKIPRLSNDRQFINDLLMFIPLS